MLIKLVPSLLFVLHPFTKVVTPYCLTPGVTGLTVAVVPLATTTPFSSVHSNSSFTAAKLKPTSSIVQALPTSKVLVPGHVFEECLGNV